jgi:TolB protein
MLVYSIDDRPEGMGRADLYRSTRATHDAPWGPPVNLGRAVNSAAFDFAPRFSPSGAHLYFSSNRRGHHDIYRIPTSELQATP